MARLDRWLPEKTELGLHARSPIKCLGRLYMLACLGIPIDRLFAEASASALFLPIFSTFAFQIGLMLAATAVM